MSTRYVIVDMELQLSYNLGIQASSSMHLHGLTKLPAFNCLMVPQVITFVTVGKVCTKPFRQYQHLFTKQPRFLKQCVVTACEEYATET